MNIGVRLIQIAVVYMSLGLILGLGMGIASDFTLASVHAHLSLLAAEAPARLHPCWRAGSHSP